MLGLLDYTAGYHQTPLDPASRELTAFQAAGGLYQRIRIAMGLKGAGPYFQQSLQTKVLDGLVYIDDVLTRGKTDPAFLTNIRRVLDSLRNTKVAVNPRKTELGLEDVAYVGHLVSTTDTSFTPEKRLKVLDFFQPTMIQRAILQSIGLANYFRDHVTNMTDLVKPFRVMLPLGRHQRTDDGELHHSQAMSPTSYMTLSGTQLPGR